MVTSIQSCWVDHLLSGVRPLFLALASAIAVQLKKTGLPQDIAVVALKAWAAKNRPSDGKRPITDSEVIRQAASVYARNYRACGCGDPAVKAYCEPSCWLRAENQRRNGTTVPPRGTSHFPPGNSQRDPS